MPTPRQDRREYEAHYGTYAQPRHAFRKIMGRLLPILPGFKLRRGLYRRLGCQMAQDVQFIGLNTYIDDVFPELISIESGVVIALRAIILAHDDASHTVAPVRLCKNCFIGAGAIILPGVTVGEGAIVGAGAVVSSDVLPHSTVGGVPAKILSSHQPKATIS